MKTLRKSKRICCFSSIALLLFAVLPPCACFADASSSLDQAAQSHNHSDCEQNKPTPSSDNHDCEDCSHCTGISTYTYDLVVKPKLAQTNSLEVFPGEVLHTAWLPTLDSKKHLGSHYVGPPGFSITNSSSLSKLFHRWLV